MALFVTLFCAEKPATTFNTWFLLNDLLITLAYIALFAAIHSAFLGYEQKKLALKKV